VRAFDTTPGSSVCRAFDLLGKRWTGLILALLRDGPLRFTELLHAVPGLSDRVMTERLRELAAAGLVQRNVDPGPPTAITYQLTDVGSAVGPVIDAVLEWATVLPEPAAEDSTTRPALT
jgi:DNA-binding HxlR family transcriptional regulator